LKLLVLGGTVFLGRHVAAEALARGHELTLFTRGIHGAGLFPEAERITADRSKDVSALRGRFWMPEGRRLAPGEHRLRAALPPPRRDA